MRKIFKKPRALNDLKDIWGYTSRNWGETQADNYLQSIEECLQRLAQSPMIGKAAYYPKEGLRCYHFQKHIIVYQHNDEIIDIVRILHERMDIKRHKLQ